MNKNYSDKSSKSDEPGTMRAEERETGLVKYPETLMAEKRKGAGEEISEEGTFLAHDEVCDRTELCC